MQLMLGLGLCLGLLGIYGVSGTMHLDQPVHANLTQNASVLCTRNGTWYCLMFDLWANYDMIDLVFSRNNTHPHINSVGSFDSNGNGIIVDNSTGYLRFWFSFYWTWPPPYLTPTAMDALAYFVQNDVLAVDVMAKWRYASPFHDMVTFPLDVLWRVSCNCSEIVDHVVVSGEITVLGNVDEYPERVVPAAEFLVILEILDLPFTTFTIGDLVFLDVEIVPQVGISVGPTGVFVYSCYICDVADCSGMNTKLIILANGCSNVPFYIDPFRRNLHGWTRTNTFPIFQLVGQEQMFFRCYVGFCYDPNDLRCIDYCDYNLSGKKRKRRQTEDEEDIVVTHTITIKRGPTARNVDGPFVTDATPAAVEQPETVGLIAAVVTLAGLLLVGLIVAVAVFFRLLRHNRVHETSKN